MLVRNSERNGKNTWVVKENHPNACSETKQKKNSLGKRSRISIATVTRSKKNCFSFEK